ncbi:SDR family NAD(P)-dependent oxidoreductase [Planctomicrobium sp. SH661]|uniref:SDR family NAD(P)-dependent oxidoreductase n=1 Tax=Planctomicrobium sp. SH661 TaxID=3448124 RepID=UPI003F5C8D02
MPLTGKRALVTGAGTGIGQGIALELGRQGADVVVHYCHSEAGALQTVEQLQNMGRRAKTVRVDFRETSQVPQLGVAALEFLQGLDILVNCSGVTMNLPFDAITPGMFETLYNINVHVPYFLTQAVLPALLESQGNVVNITSVHAYEGMREHSIYAGTRGAIVSFTRQLAIELAPRGVRVNGVAPGMVPVERYYRSIPEFDPNGAGKLLPIGRAGTVEDIARVVSFLCREDAAFIVGQTIVVDGGTTSWMPFHTEEFGGPLPYRFGAEYVPDLPPR